MNQPLAAEVTSGNDGLGWLAGEPPNLEKARQAIERIVKDANRASEVIGRVRTLAKGAPPQKDWLNINETILEIIALTRSEVEQNHISLRVQLADDLPPGLGDRVQLQQVILNLIVNAIEAMGGVGDESRELVVASAKEGANGVVVAVSDSGVGVDPDKLWHLF